MELFKSVYHNFFTVCSLIPLVFMFTLAMVFLTIRDKSKATLHLGLSFLWMSFFYFGYFTAEIFYHPMAAFHRWITIATVLPLALHLTQFIHYYPDERNPRIRKIFLYVQYLFSFAVTVVFALKTYNAPKIYHFAGHYWDFEAESISKTVGIIIILYLFIFTFTGIWKTIVTKTKERWTILVIDIVLTLALFVPALVNTMSRDGMIDRGTYMITNVLFLIIGYFVAGIIYINATKDRTNFMTKILGISLATILVVFQNLSWFSLQDLEKSYDSLRKKDLTITLDSKKTIPNLEYLSEYNIQKQVFRFINAEKEYVRGIDFNELKTEFNNTALYEEIASLPGDKFLVNVKKVLEGSDIYFSGYKNAILDLISGGIAGINPADHVLHSVKSLDRQILYTKNKIKALPDQNFKAHIQAFFAKPNPKIKTFRDAILDYTAKSGLVDAALKKEVVRFLSPFNPAGIRNYRKAAVGENFTAFMRADLKKQIIYEAGFSYLSYREFLHPSSTRFIYLLIAILLVIFIGFQFFFLGAFVRPLKNLLKGMYKVSEGNLKVKIPVSVEDELGYITHNFNRMVDNLRISNEKLADYAQNLENKVKERTSELSQSNIKLKKAMDALWGEMELAKKIQTALLPKNPAITGFEIAANMAPADEVGGDYYDIINVGDKNWLVIGDVSGHGVPAGLIMMMVQTAIQVTLVQHGDLKPSELLAIINKTITQNIKKLGEDKYMTITVISCIAGGKFFFSGLHQDIMIYRKSSGAVDLQETQGMWIGVMEDIKGMISDDSFNMNVGDAMILFSDGITEATKENSDGTVEEFGSERLSGVFRGAATGSAEHIKNAIFQAMKDFVTHDDITIVVLKRQK